MTTDTKKQNLKKQLAAVVALVVAAGTLTVIASGSIEQNLVYFWDVDQLLAKNEEAVGATVRLGGVVRNGSYAFDEETLGLTFTIAMNPDSDTGVRVSAQGQPPQMFREGIGVVVEGRYDGKVFHADRVLVKHSNEYQPPADGERPEQVYRTLMDES